MKFIAVCLLLFALSFAAYPSWTKVDFSVKRGFYDKPFNLAFTQPFVGSSIRYVIIKNGDSPIEPSATVGNLYTSGSTFQISQTCTVKAYGWTTAGLKTNVTHHSYIFVADLATQPTMLKVITQNAKFSPSLTQGFKSFPTLAVSSTTRYPNWADKSRPYFKVFMEWIDPDEPSGKNDWHASAGVEIYGGYSVNYEKKNLRFHFQDTFGTDGLEQTVFDGFDWGVGSAKKFKSLNFRSHSQDGVFGDVWDWKPITWMKNIWHDWFFQDLGHVAPHARYAHVIWNGRYEGIYHVRERMGSHFFKEYLGGEREDYCGISKGRVFDGNVAQCPWATIRANPRYAQVQNYIDWNSYLDYVIVTHYGGNADLAYEHNWQCGGPVLPAPYLGKDAGFKFFLSDQDATFWYGDIWRDITGGDFLSSTWLGLIGEKHPDFMMKFQDRIWRLLVSPRGQLLPGAVRARFDRIINKFRMNVSIVVETARWGHQSKGGAGNPFNLDNWRQHLNDLFSYYIPIRTGTTINQYYARGWMNALGAPSFNLEDGLLYENKTKIQMTYLEGSKIWYTLDATDPRTPGGGTNPRATSCLAPCEWKMYSTTTVWARVNQAGTWGPIEKMTFRSDPGYCYHCGKVVITEIMYHSVVKRAEWIEIKNIHTAPVNMNQVYFQGLRYTFPPVTLQPGQFWVIADTWEGFKKVYGRYPDDHSWLTLDDDQSTLVMRDPAGRRIQTVEYDDSRPWSELPDGYGYSLVARNYKDVAEDDPPTSPKNWRASSDKNGSPWKDDPPTKLPKINIVLNEVMANNGGNEWIEILNNGSTAQDLYGWNIVDGYRDGELYTFPKGTTLGAGQSMSFNEAKLGFQLNKLGGKIVIFQAQCCRDDGSGLALNTGEYVEFEYEPGLPSISTGWYKASNGQLKWGRLAASSAGSTANGAPWVSNIVIAGVVANIPWSNVPYRALEYVRITNNGALTQDLTKWQVRVAKEVLPLSGTLAPKQNLYVIFTTDVNHFKQTWGFDRRDPTARYVTQIKDYTNLNHWIYIDAWVPSLNALALVDSVSGSWLADIVKMKRDIEAISPADVPKEYLRNLNSKFDAQDPQSWGFQQYLPAPFDCVWNLWTEWSACSTTCAAGTQTRTRTNQRELYGGNACVGAASENRACIPGNQPCPIDCKWTEWSEWTPCPVTCMGGVQMTNRTMTPAQWGGLVCTGPSWQFRTCNENPCPVDCVLSQWTEWSDCSAKCGEGTKTRSRVVDVPNQFDGLCLEPLEDSATCQIVTCYPAWAIALIVLAGVIGILLLLALLAACIGGGSTAPGEVGSGYQAM